MVPERALASWVSLGDVAEKSRRHQATCPRNSTTAGRCGRKLEHHWESLCNVGIMALFSWAPLGLPSLFFWYYLGHAVLDRHHGSSLVGAWSRLHSTFARQPSTLYDMDWPCLGTFDPQRFDANGVLDIIPYNYPILLRIICNYSINYLFLVYGYL